MNKAIRQPSVHITWQALVSLLTEGFGEVSSAAEGGGDTSDEGCSMILADYVFKHAKKHTLVHRSSLEGNKKTARKIEKINSSGMDDAQMFASIITLTRRQQFHKGINILKEDSKDWPAVKEGTALALEFMEDFDFGEDKQRAFVSYAKIAVELMGKKFTLNRLNSLHSFICEIYRAKQRCQMDDHPEQTKAAYNYYNKIISEKVGFAPDLEGQPTKYQNFIDIVDRANKAGVTYKVFIDAQFAAFDWKAAVPEITQMVTDVAMERLAKYMFKEDIKATKPKAKAEVKFKRIR